MSAHFNNFPFIKSLAQNVLAKSRTMVFAQMVKSSVSLRFLLKKWPQDAVQPSVLPWNKT